jgi:streptomycin 6-kinase
MFDSYFARWDLVPDSEAIVTRATHLLPMRQRGRAAMLKLSSEIDERQCGVLMSWWNGEGAARVFEMADDAILLERAEGRRSLSACPTHPAARFEAGDFQHR